MLGIIILVGIGFLVLCSYPSSGGSGYDGNNDFYYRYNGTGNPPTFWDDDGDPGDGSAPFINAIDREEDW